jgi:hypothetical protein
MFERFDERARRVVVIAQEEARRLKHAEIRPEHLVLGLASVDPNLVGVHVLHLREAVAAHRAPGSEPAGGAMPFTPEANGALDRMATRPHVRPAEMALALLEAPGVDAVLADARVDIPAFRERAEAAAMEPGPSSLAERLTRPGPVPVTLGESPPIGDLGNPRTDARLLETIVARGGKVADLLRERGIDEELLRRLSR